IDVGKSRSRGTPATTFVNSYILDADPQAAGKIEEIELGEKVASTGQYVFVRMNRDARVGDRFSVVLPKGKIKYGGQGEVGPVIESGGVVEIQAPVESREGVYRAYVVSSVNPI